MIGWHRLRAGDRRGGTLVLVALSLAVLLGMGALAIDLAAGFAWRAEAQKIADSAALAGGSAFLDLPDADAIPVAEDRAYDYALRHTIKGVSVDSSEVAVQVIPAERKVRVWISRQRLPTWFARILGVDALGVRAMAAAVAGDAGAARCLKPFALPDMWTDNDQDNGDGIWDPTTEEWVFDPEIDDYAKLVNYDAPQSGETGYGSTARDGQPDGLGGVYDRDFGRPIQLKSADPQDPYNFSPGIFFPWRLPVDDTQDDCASGGGGGGQDSGGATYRNNICTCNNSLIRLGEEYEYELEPGNMVGPTAQGISDLMALETRQIEWDNDVGPVYVNSDGSRESAIGSPRVIKIALFRPDEISGSGMQSISFNNFALMFLEGQRNAQAPVIARFMYFADGEGVAGPATGSLVRFLRLVE